MGNFYVDVGFFPFFGRVALPDHVSFGGVFVEAAPAFEGGVGGHFSFSSSFLEGKRLLGWIDRLVILFLRGLEEDLKIEREGERERFGFKQLLYTLYTYVKTK